MKNRHKNWIAAGILGGALLINGNALANANSKSNLENIANQTKVIQTVDANEPNSIEYKTINEIVVRDFLGNYLEEITPKSNNFKKLRKKHGEKGLLDKYSSAHELTLKLAFNYQNKKVPKEVYAELGKQLSKKQHNTSNGLSRVDYLDKRVSKAFANWSKFKTQNFKKLLNASKELKMAPKTKEQKQDYIKKLHNLAYTKEEYADYVKNQNKANDELYESMRSTLNGVEKFFGNKEIDTIAKVTREVYSEPLNKYFGGIKDGKN